MFCCCKFVNKCLNCVLEYVNFELQELHGLKAIVMFLHSLPTNKKNVPELIRDPIALIKDVRTLVEQHRYDSPEAAVTGKPILRGPDQSDRVILVSISAYEDATCKSLSYLLPSRFV